MRNATGQAGTGSLCTRRVDLDRYLSRPSGFGLLRSLIRQPYILQEVVFRTSYVFYVSAVINGGNVSVLNTFSVTVLFPSRMFSAVPCVLLHFRCK